MDRIFRVQKKIKSEWTGLTGFEGLTGLDQEQDGPGFGFVLNPVNPVNPVKSC
jgi:hypothetical protein